ncbi:YqhG family protein [Ornithinibacillus halophilus]|uniref:Uncharacterized protein n=1 Tax=Ornithinibacillus halophilus TaxID=930117 RepID=A0A1M5D0X8_9BACI|nr:YqhG family protein [Ornithinibacillus halophilus]SHF60564.1 protein YqhG of unknown function [Ornithinibacillus halophilus]
MGIKNLDQFLYDYFNAHQCEVVDQIDGRLTVQLNEKMDRALMNRPFYWHYIKKMGQPGDPMKLTLITDHEDAESQGEKIHFGSPRLQQIWNHLRDNERFTRLFQVIHTTTNTALHPWLVVNVKLSYIGKHKKDELFSIGLNLVNGIMKTEMMEQLEKHEFQLKVSDYCYTISPIIKLSSGFKRIEAVLEDYIKNQEHQWADQSLKELDNEMKLLNHFYETNTEEEKEQMEKELQEIKERYTPKVHISIINGGLFYLMQ